MKTKLGICGQDASSVEKEHARDDQVADHSVDSLADYNAQLNKSPLPVELPLKYDLNLDESFNAWAKDCGQDPIELRRAFETAIRTRHHEAFITHESEKARGRQPDILHLMSGLGTVQVIYTVESEAVVIRGLWWEVIGEPRHECDGGIIYCEHYW